MVCIYLSQYQMGEQLATVTASREQLAQDYSNLQAALKQQTAATHEAKAALELALERARLLEEREAQLVEIVKQGRKDLLVQQVLLEVLLVARGVAGGLLGVLLAVLLGPDHAGV